MAIERWAIDSGHSGIHFAVRHMVLAKVRGQFARWSATVLAEDGELGRASVEAVIDASSIETGVADRDAHLRSSDFLDVASHPELRFHSKRIEQLSDTQLRVFGELTIRGTTGNVILHVEYNGRTKDPWGNERAGFSAKTSIDRREFGLVWNQVLEAGGLVVGDRVEIEIDVEAVKQAAANAA